MSTPRRPEESNVDSPDEVTPKRKSVAQSTEPMADVKFLTVAEVAALMRVSKMTVYRMVHAAELPAVRVGRSFRVPEKTVHAYLQAAYIEAG